MQRVALLRRKVDMGCTSLVYESLVVCWLAHTKWICHEYGAIRRQQYCIRTQRLVLDISILEMAQPQNTAG